MNSVQLFPDFCFEVIYIGTQLNFTGLVRVCRSISDCFVSLYINLGVYLANVSFGVCYLCSQNIASSLSLSDYVWGVFLAKALVGTGSAVCRVWRGVAAWLVPRE